MSPTSTRRPRAKPETDGRRLRGQDNRARIVAAMLDMVRQGELTPNAEQVADRADVGLRTVFRHFRDMDSLYREIATATEAELMTVAAQPFHGETWQARLLEMVERRAAGFEKVEPLARAAAASRYRSPFLAEAHARMVALSREMMLRQLSPEAAANRPLVEVLDLLLSIESWSRLRIEQGLSARQAREVLEVAVRRLIG